MNKNLHVKNAVGKNAKGKRATNLEVANALSTTAQVVMDTNGNSSSLALSTEKVGIGTTTPTERLTLGSGNIMLPSARGGIDGNLYFGGTTDTGAIGMRLFGGNLGSGLPSGFIDVRAETLTDGLVFRVDNVLAAIERMRITADGKVGIGTATPQERLEVKDGNISVINGDILLTNADCAEDFDICDTEQIEPGTVMVLSEDGKLQQSQTAYDTRVAGVLSGAGEYKPGIVLDRRPVQNKRMALAMVGKVYCKVDANYGAINIGDLLTTSPTPGHAMKADDPMRAFGAVIGKALRSLNCGTGLLPLLVALQ